MKYSQNNTKIYFNQIFSQCASKQEGRILILESPELLTIKTLISQGIDEKRIYIPNHIEGKEVRDNAEKNGYLHVNIYEDLSMSRFLLEYPWPPFGAVWFDYCCTMAGSPEICPQKDIETFFQRKLLTTPGIFALTVSCRPRGARKEERKIIKLLESQRITGEILVKRPYYLGMYFIMMRIDEYNSEPQINKKIEKNIKNNIMEETLLTFDTSGTSDTDDDFSDTSDDEDDHKPYNSGLGKFQCSAMIPIIGTDESKRCSRRRMTDSGEFVGPYCYFHNLIRDKLQNNVFKSLSEQHKENLEVFQEQKRKKIVKGQHLKLVQRIMKEARPSQQRVLGKRSRSRPDYREPPIKRAMTVNSVNGVNSVNSVNGVKTQETFNSKQLLLKECLKYGQTGVECFQIAFMEKN